MKPRSSNTGQIKELSQREIFPRIALVLSPDDVRRQRALEHLYQPLVGTLASNAALTRVRVNELSASALRNLILDMQTGSLFFSRRLWVLDPIGELKVADARRILTAFKSAPNGYYLLGLGESLTASHPFRAAAQGEKAIIELSVLSAGELSRWVARELAHNHIESGDAHVIETLIELGEGRPDLIAKHVELIGLYLDSDEKVSSATIRDLFPAHFDPSDYDLVEALSSHNFRKAQLLLTQLEASERSPYLLSGFLTRCWMQLTEARKLLDSGVKEGDVRNRLGLSPWVATKVMEQARRLPASVVGNGLDPLLWADTRLKGRNAGAPAVLSELAWRLTRV